MANKRRKVHSVKEELLKKSREAALAAVQVFNNPNITFKSEIYIVLMVIAWTYLMHAYYRSIGIEYRYFRMAGTRRRFNRTKQGAYKHWELERCLNDDNCPLEKEVVLNLRFLIGIRHEIEHKMTTRIDDLLSAKFQACCLNFTEVICNLFGDKYGIDHYLTFSLQFSDLSQEQIDQLSSYKNLPNNIANFIDGFDSPLTDEEFNSTKYSYRVIFVPKLANRKGQADKVIEFVRPDSEQAKKMNITYATIKETEREKFKPGTIVTLMKERGYSGFSIHWHTQLWKAEDGRNEGKGYGVEIEGQWFWYQRWLNVVEDHCKKNAEKYSL